MNEQPPIKTEVIRDWALVMESLSAFMEKTQSDLAHFNTSQNRYWMQELTQNLFFAKTLKNRLQREIDGAAPLRTVDCYPWSYDELALLEAATAALQEDLTYVKNEMLAGGYCDKDTLTVAQMSQETFFLQTKLGDLIEKTSR